MSKSDPSPIADVLTVNMTTVPISLIKINQFSKTVVTIDNDRAKTQF